MSRVDYDPVKAHEYYERHKQKTAHRSTKGMSKTKKEQWAYAKSQINDDYSQRRKNLTEESKREREQLSASAKAKMDAIRQRIKGLPKEQREALRNQIAGIRATLKSDKADLSAHTKDAREGFKTQKEADLDTAFARIKGKK